MKKKTVVLHILQHLKRVIFPFLFAPTPVSIFFKFYLALKPNLLLDVLLCIDPLTFINEVLRLVTNVVMLTFN